MSEPAIERRVFIINGDGTNTELTTDGPIKDILKTDECYVILDDTVRKVFLWKGISSSVRSKFIGAKSSQEIRGLRGMHYAVVPLDEGDETDVFLKIIGGRTEAGSAASTPAPAAPASTSGGGHPLREKPIFDAPRPAEGMNIAGSKTRQTQNTGPAYTRQTSTQTTTQVSTRASAQPAQLPPSDLDKIMQKLEESPIPEGYERELIIVGNYAYALVEKVASFLGKKQVESKMEKMGSIPEGVFFAEGYSPRLLSENGKIIAIEFLKVQGEVTKGAAEYKDKKEILKSQIKNQLLK